MVDRVLVGTDRPLPAIPANRIPNGLFRWESQPQHRTDGQPAGQDGHPVPGLMNVTAPYPDADPSHKESIRCEYPEANEEQDQKQAPERRRVLVIHGRPFSIRSLKKATCFLTPRSTLTLLAMTSEAYSTVE